MIKCIYGTTFTMFVRICLFVCAGILLVSANPIHQGINNPAKTADGVQPLEKTTKTKSDDEAVESDFSTDDHLSVKDEEGTDNQSQSEDSENEDESQSGSDKDETSNESEAEEYDPDLKSNNSDDGSESESDDESDLNTSESAKDEDSENRKIKNSVENGSDEKSDNDEPASNSEGDEVFETVDLKPENEINLSTILYNGVILRVYKFSKDDDGLICHELKRNNKILDNRCFNMQPFVPHAETVFVSVYNKFIDGQDFICQEVISNVRGLLQVLCASKEGHFYHESPVLHAGSSYTGLVDLNLPFY